MHRSMELALLTFFLGAIEGRTRMVLAMTVYVYIFGCD